MDAATAMDTVRSRDVERGSKSAPRNRRRSLRGSNENVSHVRNIPRAGREPWFSDQPVTRRSAQRRRSAGGAEPGYNPGHFAAFPLHRADRARRLAETDPMGLDVVLLIAILAYTLAAFTFDWAPIDVVALTCLGLLLVTNLITVDQAIEGFSNPAVITVMMLFILSYGLTNSGLLKKLGERIAQLAGKRSWGASAALILIAGVLSAFINNTAALAIFLPVSMQLARHYEFSPSKILLPLSYVSIIGGTCTLIGTSTNLLVSGVATARFGMEPFGVFEFFGLGAVLFVVGGIYTLTIPMKFLPPRADSSNLTKKYRLSNFLTELRVPEGSRIVGSTVVDAKIHELFQLNVLEILRDKERIAQDLRNTKLRPDDVLIVRGEMEGIVRLRERYGLLLLTDVKLEDSDLADDNNILAEIQLSPNSRLTGMTIKDIDFRKRYGCFVLALNRTGEMIREKLTGIPLRSWDTMLVFGPRSRVENLYTMDDFVPLEELNLRLRMPKRWWVSLVIIPVVVLLAATGAMPILKASILGVVAMLLSRTITIQQAYDSINWTVIFLLAAILPLGTAMSNTGLDQTLGQGIASLGEGYGPLAVLALIYLATALLSEIVSNNSTAVLMAPIAFTAAAKMGVDPKPFLMGVAYAASASFLTPMGYQTNAMVYGPGSYKFIDYMKFGAPLKVIFWILSVWLIPMIWEF